jgi:hypothetical protein
MFFKTSLEDIPDNPPAAKVDIGVPAKAPAPNVDISCGSGE